MKKCMAYVLITLIVSLGFMACDLSSNPLRGTWVQGIETLVIDDSTITTTFEVGGLSYTYVSTYTETDTTITVTSVTDGGTPVDASNWPIAATSSYEITSEGSDTILTLEFSGVPTSFTKQ